MSWPTGRETSTMTVLPVRLPDGLILRSAIPGDRDAFVSLQSDAHKDSDGKPNAAVGAWSAELFDRAHPTMELADITVVEDPATGALVSGLTLVPQTWSYGGIPFGVGRLELVATHADYRRRGLIGRQFEALHERGASRGQLMQVITDLMFFHQEHDYHAVLTQRAGRGGWTRDLPSAPSAGEPAGLRCATAADAPFLESVDRHAGSRALLTCTRDRALWEYELTGRSRDNMMRDEIFVIEQGDRPVGYALSGYGGIPSFPIPSWLPGQPCPESVTSISGLELVPDASWSEILPSILRQTTGADGYMLWLGTEHPAYQLLSDLLVRRPPDIGWFLRIPDLVAFLRHVAPVLEKRLADSAFRGHTGTLRLHFYTFGLRLRFHGGELADIDRWPEHARRSSDASMPVAMFLSLLFGHADLAELAPAYADHRLQTQLAAALLATLFPKLPSRIWPVI
ncbi:GNAT family N-acetyltransferase [Nocardia sp. 2YAB30]|uniref:GNAT family N-acetyltransferase n=1 Tax=unclassified Nocardia TaxID=2637762 RepID=UPI003F9B3F26